jgi:hypothetical protein
MFKLKTKIIMKNYIFILAAIFCVHINAQEKIASLQKGSDMTLYKGEDAFQKAYEAADSGSVITLSTGRFGSVQKIEKSIRIVGTYGFNDLENTILPGTTISADNVSIEGVYFSGSVILDSISNCRIVKCYLYSGLSSVAKHYNTIVSQCYVSSDAAIRNAYNYCVKNSVITFAETNTSNNIAYITNCSVLGTTVHPIAIYKNNYIEKTGTLSPPCEYYYNVFPSTPSYSYGCQRNGNRVIEMNTLFSGTTYFKPKNPGNGQDGTLVGPQGGTGFSPYPSIPRIISQEISTSTDQDGNISVQLDVKAEP